MTYLFLKIESTGLPKKAPLSDASQPRIMRLSAIMRDTGGRDLGSIDTLMKPDGTWLSSNGAQAKHQISDIDCTRYGVRPRAAIATLFDMARCCGHVIAFNMPFIDHMIAVEVDRAKANADDWLRPGLKRVCLMLESAQILNGGTSINMRDAVKGFYPEQQIIPDSGLDAVDGLAWLYEAVKLGRLKK